MTVRPALPQDAAPIAALGRSSFTWAFGHLYRPEVLARYLDATYSEAKLAASLAKASNVYFVAEAEGVLLGFLKLKVDSPRAGGVEWQTQKLYVDPALVQRGVGRALMAAGEALMRARGVEASWLVVYEGNARALRFYEDLGYREAGAQTHSFEELVVPFKVLAKDLS
jgi:diamine N-acetyltransferase